MICDYERAWHELGELVASKSQHGREGLLTEMANIAARCRVPGGELSRLLRLYGVEVERARSVSAETVPADAPASLGVSHLERIEASRAIIDGGHDGRSNGRRGTG